jgi:SSS family solute:Na+ symporter
MSTISSCLNAFATLLLTDYYRRYFRPAATQRQSMRILHGGTIFAGVLGTGTALLMSLFSRGNTLDVWWELAGILGGGMLGLFLLGFISRRASSPIALVATLAGLLVILWMTFSPRAWPRSLAMLRSPFHSSLITVFGTLMILLIGLLLSRVKSAAAPSTKEWEAANSRV